MIRLVADTRQVRWALILLLAALPLHPTVAQNNGSAAYSYRSASVPPSALSIRKANQQGQPAPHGEPGVMLNATLTVPEGEGQFPAIVLFPDCYGWNQRHADWTHALNEWGYAVLTVDSLASRADRTGTCNRPGFNAIGSTDIVFDTVASIRRLASLDFIDPDRIAVMGWGFSATGVLKAANQQGFARLFPERPAAAVAFYPSCEVHSTFTAPVLVLTGEDDQVFHPVLCEVMRSEVGQTTTFELEVLPGLGHNFDQPGQLSAEPDQAIRQRIETFLARHL